MTRAHLLIALGILIALAPFSGLPGSWLDIILPLLGLATLAVGYSLRTPAPKKESSQSLESIAAI